MRHVRVCPRGHGKRAYLEALADADEVSEAAVERLSEQLLADARTMQPAVFDPRLHYPALIESVHVRPKSEPPQSP